MRKMQQAIIVQESIGFGDDNPRGGHLGGRFCSNRALKTGACDA